jgi:hypothetical protein
MPNHEEHCLHSEERYGIRGDDIHAWMDEPSQIAGGGHRRYRHDLDSLPIAIRMFGEKYGNETVKNIFLDHLKLDSEEERQQPTEPESVIPLPYKRDWGERILLATPSGAFFIVFVYLINVIMGDPIGLWWSQNWYKVIGATVFMIVWVLITYAFRNKNKIVKVAFLYAGFIITVFYLFNVFSGDFVGLWWSQNWAGIIGFSVFMVLVGILCVYGWRKIKKKDHPLVN